MTGRTHLLAGAAAALAAASLAGAEPARAGLIGALAGLGPDIDTFSSKAGRALPVLPLIPWPGGHRGFTHSLAAAALVSAGAASWLGPEAVLAVAAGWVSHIVLDLLNPEGVQIFWPLGRFSLTRRLPGRAVWRTGGPLDLMIGWALALGVIVWTTS